MKPLTPSPYPLTPTPFAFAFALALQLITPTLYAFPWDVEQPQHPPLPYEPQFPSLLSTRRFEFFDVPPVESTDTPGSVDWYVPGVTGRTYSVGFTIYVNGTVNTDLVMAPMRGMFPDEKGFYCWNLPLVDDDEYYPGSDTILRTDATAPFGAKWWGQHEERSGDDTTMIINDYTARVSQFTNATWYTGFWRGRAARLTPKVCAGVFSTFEGLYERMYYASQYGGTNWTVSATNGWGGTTPETFRLDGAAGTNDWRDSFFQDYHNPTDGVRRTMRRVLNPSHRLIEIENIARFTGEGNVWSLCGTNCPPGGIGIVGGIDRIMNHLLHPTRQTFRISRPTWPEVWQWSSSMLDDLDGEQEIPTVAWTENPWEAGGGDGVWLKCCRPLRALGGTTNVVRAFDWPVGRAFSEIACGEDFWYKGQDAAGLVYDSTNALIRHTFDGMLTNFYRTCRDVYEENIFSRRLKINALARANQRLSALDRTIMDGQVAHTNRMIIREFVSGMRVGGKVTITGGEYGFDWQPAEWGSVIDKWEEVYTNRTEIWDGDRQLVIDVDWPTGTGAGVKVSPASLVSTEYLYLQPKDDLLRWAAKYGPIHFLYIEPGTFSEPWPIMYMTAENDPDHITIAQPLANSKETPPGVGEYEIRVECVGMKHAVSQIERPDVADYYLTGNLQPLDGKLLNKISSQTASAFLRTQVKHYTEGVNDETNTAYCVLSEEFRQPADMLQFVRSCVEAAYAKMEREVSLSVGWDGDSAPKISLADLEPGFSRGILWSFGEEYWEDIFFQMWDPLHENVQYLINKQGEVEAWHEGSKLRTEPWPFCCARIRRDVIVDGVPGPAPVGARVRARGVTRYYDVETVDWEWDAVRRDKKY